MKILTEHIDVPQIETLAVYKKNGGYKAVEKAFDRVYTQMLSRRPNEVVSTRVVVPIETQSGISQGRSVRQALVLNCEQRPAIWVSDALHADYAADGVQGAHCHERTQHKHAVTLHVSKMAAADGQCGLTLVRHGVLSPNQLTRKGIKKLRDDLERFSFNTGVSSFMICVNELTDQKCNNKQILEELVVLLSAYAPHICEELWVKLGHEAGSINKAAYPKFNEAYLVSDSFS